MEQQKSTFNQIQDQYDSGHTTASVLVPIRGQIRVAQTWGEKTGEGKTAVGFGEGDDAKLFHVKNEDLTDERQAELAAELAGYTGEAVSSQAHNLGKVSMEAVDVDQPSATKKDSEQDSHLALLRRRYEAALEDKRQAQRMGNGEGSTQFGQIAGQLLKEIDQYKKQHGIIG